MARMPPSALSLLKEWWRSYGRRRFRLFLRSGDSWTAICEFPTHDADEAAAMAEWLQRRWLVRGLCQVSSSRDAPDKPYELLVTVQGVWEDDDDMPELVNLRGPGPVPVR